MRRCLLAVALAALLAAALGGSPFYVQQVARCNEWKRLGGFRVYDAVPFFEELDVLEIRLAELGGCVDFHVIAESTVTHTGNPKELQLKRALEAGRFAQHRSRIRYVEVDDMPECGEDAWTCENFQREALARGLRDLSPGDFLLLMDLDEVPSVGALSDAVHMHALKEPAALDRLTVFSLEGRPFAIHWRRRKRWDLAYGLSGHLFANSFRSSPQAVRYALSNAPGRGRRVTYVSGGWHLSSFGPVERIRRKIASFAHQEFNRWPYTSTDFIESRVRCGKDLFERGEGEDAEWDPPTPEAADRFPALLQSLDADPAASLAAARARFPLLFGHERADGCPAMAAAAGAAALDEMASISLRA